MMDVNVHPGLYYNHKITERWLKLSSEGCAMIELRQVVSYLLGLAVVVAILSAGAAYGILEGAQYVPVQPNVPDVRIGSELASSNPMVRQGPPVWIAPTPKYNYDPKLMIVRPREEREANTGGVEIPRPTGSGEEGTTKDCPATP